MFVNTVKRNLPTPIILDESLRHVTRGNDLSVNCSVDNVDSSMIFILDWITPKHVSFSGLYLFDYNIYISLVSIFIVGE